MNLIKNTINANIIKVNPRASNEPYGPKTALAESHNLLANKKKIPLIPS